MRSPLVRDTQTQTHERTYTPTHTHKHTYAPFTIFFYWTVYTTSHTQTIHYFKCYIHPYSLVCNKTHFPIVYVQLCFVYTYIIVFCVYILFLVVSLYLFTRAHITNLPFCYGTNVPGYTFSSTQTSTYKSLATHLSTQKCIAYIFPGILLH